MGDRTKIRLRHDSWCGDQPLKKPFSEFFSIACCKEAWIADYVQVFNGNV